MTSLEIRRRSEERLWPPFVRCLAGIDRPPVHAREFIEATARAVQTDARERNSQSARRKTEKNRVPGLRPRDSALFPFSFSLSS